MFPEQDVAATRFAFAIYWQLARQDRAIVNDIAAEAVVSGNEVAARLDAWPAVCRDEDGAVIGI